MTPLFSIVIGLYNQAEYLPLLVEALEQQTFKSFEVHFCDDGSTDGTAAFMSALNPAFAWEYHRQENSRSFAKNVNQGARKARGAYCVFIAGDSFPEPDYLDILREHVAPHRLVCGTRIQVDGGQGVDLDWRLKKAMLPPFPTILAAEPWNLMTGNGLTIPTEAMQDFGFWEESFVGYGGEDNEIVGRMYFHGLVCWSVPDLRLYHHWHKSKGVDRESNTRALELISKYASYGF